MTPAPRLAPWWLEEALRVKPGDPPALPLAGDLDVDVAIVGGGYTGMWTALALTEREPSLRVAVLDASDCGWGASGRNGGFLHGYWSTLPRAREVFGDERALELAQASSAIVPAVRAFLEQRGEDAWLREGGMLKVSAAPAQDASVERALATLRELGAADEARALDGADLARHLASPVLRRGVLFRDGATVHPGRLIRAMRRAVLSAGVHLHERTRVRALSAGRPNRLETGGGRVRAGAVVLATNAALAGFRPAARHITAFGSHVVLTAAAPERLEAIGWTGDEAIVDGRLFLHYFRRTVDGRVLMGTASGLPAPGGRIDRLHLDRAAAERAERALRRLLPGLDGVPVQHAWGGAVDVASDHFPTFATVPGTSLHYGAGYSGNGVGPSWMGGQILASLALGAVDEWSRSPLVDRRPPAFPPEPLRYVGGRLVRAAAVRVEEAQEAGRKPPLAARAVAAAPELLGLRVGRR